MPQIAETTFENLFLELRQEFPQIEAGKMFGKRCLKVNGKAFACLFGEAMSFKLKGEDHQATLKLESTALWDPSGKHRPMKAWVLVPVDQHQHWYSIASQALIGLKQDQPIAGTKPEK
jgi:hypothetical protein